MNQEIKHKVNSFFNVLMYIALAINIYGIYKNNQDAKEISEYYHDAVVRVKSSDSKSDSIYAELNCYMDTVKQLKVNYYNKLSELNNRK